MDKQQQKEIQDVSHPYLYFISFIAGALVMTIEVTASRLLAPFFGSSLFIWTSAISVILAALSVGYFIASKLSEREDVKMILVYALFGASIMTFFAPHAVYFIGSFLPGYAANTLPSSSLFVTTFIVSLLVLMPAGVFYGFFSPLIIEILGRNGHHPGRVSGKIFALSTVGSIIGTISGAIFFIPFIGTHNTFLIASIVMSLLVLGLTKKYRILSIVFALSILLIGSYTKPNPLKNEQVVAYTPSKYQDIALIDEGDHYSFIFNEGFGVQSVHYKETPFTSAYWDWLTLIPYMREKEKQDILFIGFAGGTSSRLFAETNVAEKIQSIDAVEIDEEVVKMTRSFFSPDDYGVNVHISDGRQYLQTTEKQYDMILVDAFNGLSMPFQFSTIEFNQLIQSRLQEEGVMALNIALGLDGSPIVQGLFNTSAEVFDHVYAFGATDSFNIVLLATNTPIDEERLDRYRELAGIPYQDMYLKEYHSTNKDLVFTDDKSPIEFLSDFTVISAL